MGKKTFIASLILLLLLLGVIDIGVGNANPVLNDYPKSPVTDTPMLLFISPENNTVVRNATFVSFNVTKPDSWYQSGQIGNILQINYTSMDGQQTTLLATTTVYDNLPMTTQFYIVPTGLREGLNALTVSIKSRTWYDAYGRLGSYEMVTNDTLNFIIDNATVAQPSPSFSPSATWLTIDLADHNYMNNVPVGQSVYFSAVVSNGLAPCKYQWKFRPYYVGTALGDFYPTGDWIEGAATQNFTFTPNSTGSYLIEVKVWDSAGVEGLFMSLPPGIWVNSKNSTSASPCASTPPNPSVTLSPAPTPPPPIPSPTLQPTQVPSETPTYTGSNMVADPIMNYTPVIIVSSVLVMVAVLGVAAYLYFGKRRR